jgi:predicted esterase
MLHGIGDCGKGWASIADDVDLPHAKWMFPTAPVRPLTAKFGKPTSAWANVNLLSIEGPDDEQGTMETKDMIHHLIAEEVRRGIPAHRIFIGGFSQGGAMACVAVLTHKQQLAGCFVLSGYMTMHKTLPFLLTDEGRRTPFFQVHTRAHARARARALTHNVAALPFAVSCLKETSKIYWMNLAFKTFFFFSFLAADVSYLFYSAAFTSTFQAHGEDDRTVPLLFGQARTYRIRIFFFACNRKSQTQLTLPTLLQASSQLIRSLGVTCDFKRYPRCCHCTCPQV